MYTPLVGFYGTPGDDAAEAVRARFRRTGGGSLYLAGEPYSSRPDSLFDATYVAQRQHQLVLELNGWLLLVFNVVPQVRASRNMLTLTGHSQCLLFEPRGKSTSAKVRVYRDQEVSFGGGAV